MQMPARKTMIVGLLGLAMLSAAGCKTPWTSKQPQRTKSAFDRDPLVMAHLTHAKDDPAYRDSDIDFSPSNEPRLQPASATSNLTRSNKPMSPGSVIGAIDGPIRGRAPDYSWLRGTVRTAGNRFEENAVFLDFGRSDGDRFGGKIKLANSPRLELLRDGDLVYLTGQLRTSQNKEPIYTVDNVVLLR